MFETKDSVGLAKQRLTYIARLIGKLRNEHPSISSPVAPYEPTNSRANLREAELKKSHALMRWQMLTRPE